MATSPLRDRALGASFAVLLGCAIVSGLTAYLDVHSGTTVRVFPLYFLPVALVAWNVGVRHALAGAAFAAAAWEFAHHVESGTEHETGLTLVWNLVMLASTFFAFAWAIGRFSRVLGNERAESRRDGLTSLLNRRGFEESMEVELARAQRYGHHVTVAFMDLDGFKRVNDVAGHETGDRLLREVASGLRQTLRAHDIVGRFGGDEFCVALVAADPDDATAVLDRIRATISDLALAKAFDVTISIGSVTVGGVSNPSSLEQAIREADKLMYEAKTRSKRRVRSPLLAESATGELSPTPGPRDALASIGPS